jgi:hypothetical protein
LVISLVPLQQFKEFGHENEDCHNEDQGDDGDDSVGCTHVGAGFHVVSVAEGAADAAARDVRAVLPGGLITAVNVSEHCFSLLFLRIIVTGLVVENPVRLIPEESKIEQTGHSFILSLTYKNTIFLAALQLRGFRAHRPPYTSPLAVEANVLAIS